MFIGFCYNYSEFQVSVTAGFWSCDPLIFPGNHHIAQGGIKGGKATAISTFSSLPTSRLWEYVTGVKNCYAKLLTGNWELRIGHWAWE